MTYRIMEKQLCYRRVEGAPCGNIIEYIKIRHTIGTISQK